MRRRRLQLAPLGLAISVAWTAIAADSNRGLAEQDGAVASRPRAHSTRPAGPAPRTGHDALPSDHPLTNRDPRRHDAALRRFGGDRETERAVADGLAWLAAHQRVDGVWDRKAFDRLCPADDRCGQTSLLRSDLDADVGVSALALLAFLGAGYTHERGPYVETITRGFEFILAQQDADGSFSSGSGLQMYNDAIAVLAVAEAYAVTRDPVFPERLQRVVRHLERAQQDGGGWDYTADTRTRRCDTSVTGWVLMALKSAEAAGVGPSLDTRFRVAEFLDGATEASGRVWYADRGTGVAVDPETGRRTLRYGPAMTAVGLYARSALGYRMDDAAASKQIALLLSDPPDLRRMMQDDATELHSEYYWYYGTLALFNSGGPSWTQWNESIRRTVMEYQERPQRRNGEKRHAYGSWPAFGRGWGKWGRTGSRIYATAVNTLTLEIYYRYLPAYLAPRGLIGPIEMRERMRGAGPRRQAELLEWVGRLHDDVAEPMLLEFLESEADSVRLAAAIQLARLGAPSAEPELRRQRGRVAMTDVPRINRALAELAAVEHEFDCGEVTEVNKRARMFLFNTAGRRVYYGQPVTVLRDGRPVATGRVTRRFTAQDAAAAKLDLGSGDAEARDTVTTRRLNDERPRPR